MRGLDINALLSALAVGPMEPVLKPHIKEENNKVGRWVDGSVGTLDRWAAGSLGRWATGYAGSLGRWIGGRLGGLSESMTGRPTIHDLRIADWR